METDKRIEEIASIVLLSKVKGFGPVRFREVYERFHSFTRFVNYVHQSIESLKDTSHIEKMVGKKVWPILMRTLTIEKKKECEKVAQDVFAKAKEVKGHLITFYDDCYPQSLYRTNQSVPIIYAIGDTNILKSQKTCAIVGTRKPTSWTIQETRKLVKRLVSDRYVIVSGLAKGIDAISHETALDNGGNTIAVMGCGPDVYYPAKNKDLQNRIMKSDLVISEYPFGSKVTGLSLRKRNKITVGLSNVVYITETSVTGGTMNSYLAAVEQKKPVKVFLPISDIGGHFSGNLRILNDQRIDVERLPTESEPNIHRLREIEAVIFDLDGTIWDSREALMLTLNSVLKENRKEFDEKDIKKMIDSESPHSILRSFGISDMASFWRTYRRNYRNIKLFSKSARDILSNIAESGRKIGVVTTLKGNVTRELLEYFGLDEMFSVVVSPSDTRARKPSPIPILKAIDRLKVYERNAIYIGDNDVDILAAKAAKCLSGVAAWNKSASISKKPDYVFPRFEDLLLILK